jgi:hypothetical protein
MPVRTPENVQDLHRVAALVGSTVSLAAIGRGNESRKVRHVLGGRGARTKDRTKTGSRHCGERDQQRAKFRGCFNHHVPRLKIGIRRRQDTAPPAFRRGQDPSKVPSKDQSKCDGSGARAARIKPRSKPGVTPPRDASRHPRRRRGWPSRISRSRSTARQSRSRLLTGHRIQKRPRLPQAPTNSCCAA